MGNGTLQVNTASDNTAIGAQALYLNTTGTPNTAVGKFALYNNLTGTNNVAVGDSALVANTASANTAVGSGALSNNNAGTQNSAVGINSLLSNTSGNFNSALGVSALQSNTTGTQNLAVGGYALQLNNIGSQNSGVGNGALQNNTTGNNNASLGYNSGNDALITLSTQSNYVVLGNNATQFLYCKTATITTSDVRDKIVDGAVPHGLDFVNQINPISYKFKAEREDTVPADNEPVRYGFSAQEILALEGENPAIIEASNPDKLALNSAYLIPVLVNAIKELSSKNEALEARLAKLEGK